MKRQARQAALALLLALPAQAAGPEDFLAALEARLGAARAQPVRADAETACAATLADAFDTALLAEAVAGEAVRDWPAPERAALAAAIASRLARECRDLLRRPDPGPARVLRLREGPGGPRLTVEIPSGEGPGHIVTWTLVPGGPLGWRAREMLADGRGLAATLRAEFEGALAMRSGDRGAAIRDLARGQP